MEIITFYYGLNFPCNNSKLILEVDKPLTTRYEPLQKAYNTIRDRNRRNTNKRNNALIEEVLTANEQATLTPDSVIKGLKEGNQRFVEGELKARDHTVQIRKTVDDQFPKAVILSCVDSRVPVEDVFDKGIGDVFVARVAGNFVNEDILGSMEFGYKISGSKVILVLGHEHCGAVKAAVDDVKLGNITTTLSKIRPAVESVEYEGDRSSKNKEFLHMACVSNVRKTIQDIRINSPILKEIEHQSEIKIIGGVYDMDTGEVDFL